mgnify:CR=1 FL=1
MKMKSQNCLLEDRQEVALLAAHHEAAPLAAHHVEDLLAVHHVAALLAAHHVAALQKVQADPHQVRDRVVRQAVPQRDRVAVLRQVGQKVVLQKVLNVAHQNE